MSTILLIDGDQFLFKATAAVEKEVRWDEQNHVLFSNFNEAHENFTAMLERLFTRFDTRDHALCFSTTTTPNFRLSISPDYKGNRKDLRKPICYWQLKEYVDTAYNVVSMPSLEADDVMGILATKPQNNGKAIIVSQDKDMRTIPGRIWTGRGDMQIQYVSEQEADYRHLYQTLIGDVGDGYKGCPGVGPKKAEALLHDISVGGFYVDKAWPVVVKTYEKAGLTEADALTQARLARILRWDDWDRDNKRAILWTPTDNKASPPSSRKS